MPTATVADPPVADAFRALGDPVRLAIVEHLGAHGEASVNDLAALFPITLQAVSKHVKVLEAAGVVSQRRDGRHRPVRLEAGGVARATDWLAARLTELEDRYARLDALLAQLQETPR